MFCRLFKALSLPCYFAIWVHFRRQCLTRYVCVCVYVYRSLWNIVPNKVWPLVKKNWCVQKCFQCCTICVLILCITSYKTGLCPTLSADAEPVRKHMETIFSAQCAVWCNQKCTIGFNGFSTLCRYSGWDWPLRSQCSLNLATNRKWEMTPGIYQGLVSKAHQLQMFWWLNKPLLVSSVHIYLYRPNIFGEWMLLRKDSVYCLSVPKILLATSTNSSIDKWSMKCWMWGHVVLFEGSRKLPLLYGWGIEKIKAVTQGGSTSFAGQKWFKAAHSQCKHLPDAARVLTRPHMEDSE